MSSHHIIRDEQEPPVLVFQINDNWQQLSEILGWTPILIINPLLKDAFESRQTKIDGYLIEENSDINTGVKDLIYSDSDLVQSLVNWVDRKKCTALNIFCNDDLMMSLFHQLKTKPIVIPFIFFTSNGKYILKPNSKFKKWYPENCKIDIVNDDIKSIKNLKQDGGGYYVEKEGFITIEVEGDLTLIKEK
jgi:thiamine pyrophosphokinase